MDVGFGDWVDAEKAEEEATCCDQGEEDEGWVDESARGWEGKHRRVERLYVFRLLMKQRNRG